jgi:hypothetical protein
VGSPRTQTQDGVCATKPPTVFQLGKVGFEVQALSVKNQEVNPDTRHGFPAQIQVTGRKRALGRIDVAIETWISL